MIKLWHEHPNFRFLLYLIFYFVYLLACTGVFIIIEGNVETETRKLLLKHKKDFYKKIQHNVSLIELDNFLIVVERSCESGVSAIGNLASFKEKVWTFGNSLFFSTSLFTTVGYGYTSPLSGSGKIVCIFFAITGIPLTIMLITGVVDRLLLLSRQCLRLTVFVLDFIVRKCRNSDEKDYVIKEKIYLVSKISHIVVSSLFIIFFSVLLPAIIFSFVEFEWTYIDALYYCIITITTVGLGDFIPGDSVKNASSDAIELYRVLTSIYIILGICLISLFIAIFYRIAKFKKLSDYLLMRIRYTGNKNVRDEYLGINNTPIIPSNSINESIKSTTNEGVDKETSTETTIPGTQSIYGSV
ncbi:Potassium channel subfamily K member 1 [Intoshia linei]|uniref:Potassium channel subfamily K member 1 n=1 Tax=Intoshia linei TaxID=1819745 RepID=A0A177B2M9_9BILA|nr:Potassium channel subfamily K member 1 [Intoshia linei]